MILLQIAGRVGGDAVAERVNDQFAIKFSVCHSSSYTDSKGDKINNSIWVRCTLWAKKDNISQHIRKGDVVYVSGTPKAHGWMDQERNVRSQLEMTVKTFEFVHSKREDPAGNGSATPAPAPATGAAASANPTPENVDDLPF